MIIYKLTTKQSNQVYVGKTVDLTSRFNNHKSDYRCWLNGKRDFKSSYFISKFDDVKIEKIEETNNSLREVFWIQKLDCCNFQHNDDSYFIYKLKDKNTRKGFIYSFQVMRGGKKIIRKTSTNIEWLKKFRDDWIEKNPHIFMA